ncbi:hypothetical protein [Streptomyces sp. GS7]|uniref:hypothetical protein n=1 Tax=Streptomyces sp. GS7 TaxID=2692234 RepID=UPI0013181808|nr:hypothetical protein [Streptomyces sp. GS7]QHC20614.1 hypothetical protein GR130_03355 [Streptomyces sp. GS7]
MTSHAPERGSGCAPHSAPRPPRRRPVDAGLAVLLKGLRTPPPYAPGAAAPAAAAEAARREVRTY